jgi:WD40 repeat protein
MSGPGDSIITLDSVIGLNTSPNSVFALDRQRIVYISGNVAVIYNEADRHSKLLRGHVRETCYFHCMLPIQIITILSYVQRNPVRSVCLNKSNGYIVSGCGGSNSTIIYWDYTGVPIVVCDNPHPLGTQAMDVSADGKFLATLSLPFSDPTTTVEDSYGQQHTSTFQEVRVWRMPVQSSEDGSWGEFSLVASCVNPVTDMQHSVTFNHTPIPEALLSARGGGATRTLGSGGLSSRGNALTSSLRSTTAAIKPVPLLQLLYEFASTGTSSVLFWSMSAAALDTTGTNGATTTLSASLRTFTSTEAAVMAWRLSASIAKVPNTATVGPTVQPPGDKALPVMYHHDLFDTVDVQDSGLATVGPANTLANTVKKQPTTTMAAAAAHRTCNTTIYVPQGMLSGSTRISALTGTSDGTLILWSSDIDIADEPLTSALPGMFIPAFLTAKTAPVDLDVLFTAGQRLTNRSAGKTVKLTRPNAGDLEGHGVAQARINTLNLSPCAKYTIVGSEDGDVRAFDMQMRLVAWWDEITAGPITSLSFVPAKLIGEPGYSPTSFPVAKPAGVGLPDFLLGTRSSLLLRLSSSSFDSTDAEARKGTILLEGPDAAVVGIVSYPLPHANLLAVAVASGCVQLWDASTQQLLAVRELVRTQHFAAGSAAAAAAALQAPQVFHPATIAVDRYARFLAVGTTEGFLCLLDPLTLADTQAPIAPPTGSTNITSTGMTTTVNAQSGLLSMGGAAVHHAAPVAKSRGAAITRLVFADDGLHLAGCDTDRHVMLWRFTRNRTKQVSTRATSRLGLGGGTGALNGRRHFAGGSAPRPPPGHAGGGSPRRPRPWELVDGDESGLEEVIVDTWEFMGRARTHSDDIAGVCFSTLAPEEVSPHVLDVDGNFMGGFEGGVFWDSFANRTQTLFEQHKGAGISLLASVGKDRKLVLYDCGASSIGTGLIIAGHGQRHGLTQLAVPTCVAWYPPCAPLPDTELRPEDALSCIMVADNKFKLKLWSVSAAQDTAHHTGRGGSSKDAPPQCRKTVLGPTFGGSLTHMAPIHTAGNTTPFMAFATDDRIIGVLGLPLTGNPFSAVGAIAHPGPVTGLAVSASGTHLYTCGLESASAGGPTNGSVCVWRFAAPEFTEQCAAGGTGLAPFLSLLEGGADGAMYQSICDMFSYAQIRSQGETSTQRRRAGITLPLSEVAAVMRALGFYPTMAEIGFMMTETRAMNAARLATEGGSAFGITNTEEIDLPTLIQLYVNHRPVVAVGSEDLTRALTKISAYVARTEGIAAQAHGSSRRGSRTAADEKLFSSVRWGSLARLLAARGERMNPTELRTCLTALMGPPAEGVHIADHEELSIQDDIVDHILGFQVREE